jgi:hypothetical protein
MRTRRVWTAIVTLLAALGIVAAGATAASAKSLHDDGLASVSVVIR